MKITKIKHVKDCFDGSFIYELNVSTNITFTQIQFLGSKGKLEYHPKFARPFFKVTFNNSSYIKGVEDNKHLQLTIFNNDELTEIINLINGKEANIEKQSIEL